LAGATLAQVPEHSASLWNRYDINPQWGLGLGTVYRSQMYAATDNAVVLPGFVRFDGAIYYTASPRLQLQVNIENLLDKDYYASAHSNTNITPGSPIAANASITMKF
jgi:catecholate siderophore receptor